MTAGQLIAILERRGPILWEAKAPEGRRQGWAVCPCCDKRELWVDLPDDDDDKVVTL